MLSQSLHIILILKLYRMRLILLLACLFTSCTLIAQIETPRIAWSKKSLRWKDFKRKPDSTAMKSPWGAVTNSWVEQKYWVTPQHEVHFSIIAWFNPDFSWVKDDCKNGNAGNYALMHEQHHFDMTELYARKIRKVLSSLELTDSTYRKEIAQLFKNFYTQFRLQQERYDKETEHGRNMTMQYNWVASIDDEMKALSAYSDTVTIVKLK
jgi:hypothetical protein